MSRLTRRRLMPLILVSAMLAVAPALHAQPYPNKPIKIIAPVQPGAASTSSRERSASAFRRALANRSSSTTRAAAAVSSRRRRSHAQRLTAIR